MRTSRRIFYEETAQAAADHYRLFAAGMIDRAFVTLGFGNKGAGSPIHALLGVNAVLIGGAWGAVFLRHAVSKGWVVRELDSRALRVIRAGQQEFLKPFGVAP